MHSIARKEDKQTIAAYTDEKSGNDVVWLQVARDDGYEAWLFVNRPAPFYLFVRNPSGQSKWVELSTIANGPLASFAPFFTVHHGKFTDESSVSEYVLADPSLGGSSLTIGILPGTGPSIEFRGSGGSVASFELPAMVDRALKIGAESLVPTDESLPPLPDIPKVQDPDVVPNLSKSEDNFVVPFVAAVVVTAFLGGLVVYAGKRP